ncbi:hypothetical protein MBLNU230_g6726t1 [Neophaeotheca triangularis]
MSKPIRLPPALEPYLTLPPELSLLLFTGTLGCSPTWLVARHIAGILGEGGSGGRKQEKGAEQGEEDETETAVVLVSWMRDETFWRTELRRSCNLDPPRLTSQKRYTFIDALSPSTPLLDLSSLLPNLPSPTPKRKTHLILDHPEPLLHLTPPPSTPTSQTLLTQLLHLRSTVHSASLVLPSDEPLLSPATASAGETSTPLATEISRFIVGVGWQARFVLGCRELGTGAARDVSGVLRVSRGGGWDREGEEEEEQGEKRAGDGVEGLEVLYLVARDGRAEVFERGAGFGGGGG